MRHRRWLLGLVLSGFWVATHAQVPPAANPDQLSMLKSDNPVLARNKRFVFDFWRIVFEGGHMDKAPQYMAATYIQHNPNVESGRAAFVALFSKVRPPRPVASRIRAAVIAITAEGNLVIVSTARKVRDRQNPKHIYYMTWFDMFRIDDQGLIAEHWDPSQMWVNGEPPGAEFFQ